MRKERIAKVYLLIFMGFAVVLLALNAPAVAAGAFIMACFAAERI